MYCPVAERETVHPEPAKTVPETETVPRMNFRFSSPLVAKYCPLPPSLTSPRTSSIAPGEPVVIVEDVVTTGKSTKETADVVKQHGGAVVGFASILNRSGKANPFDAPYESLMSLALETYDEARCPLCKSGVPLDAPGSRFTR